MPALERVSEQDEAVGIACRLEQRRACLRLARDIDLGARTEMQVGDDQRAGQLGSLGGGRRQRLAKRLGKHEADVLLDHLELADVGRTA